MSVRKLNRESQTVYLGVKLSTNTQPRKVSESSENLEWSNLPQRRDRDFEPPTYALTDGITVIGTLSVEKLPAESEADWEVVYNHIADPEEPELSPVSGISENHPNNTYDLPANNSRHYDSPEAFIQEIAQESRLQSRLTKYGARVPESRENYHDDNKEEHIMKIRGRTLAVRPNDGIYASDGRFAFTEYLGVPIDGTGPIKFLEEAKKQGSDWTDVREQLSN